jgi:hypothetical protein
MPRDRSDRRCVDWRLWVIAALAFLPVAAVGQGADELASMIEQSLAGIEYRLDLRPKQAAQDLQEQERRLELLEQQAPGNPALPGLRQKFRRLQAAVASGLAGTTNDAVAGESAAAASAPEGLTSGLRAVDTLQERAESELMSGRPGEAAQYLSQAEAQMVALEARYAGKIPEGHVPLIVAQEKLAALKDQLAAAKSAD